MTGHLIVREFIKSLDPEDLPFEYLHAAKIKGENGTDIIVTGDDLRRLITNDPTYDCGRENEIEVFLNINKIMKAVNMEVEYIYHCVEQKFLAEEAAKNNSEDS